MNQREAKIVALELGHRVLMTVSPNEVLNDAGVSYNASDMAKITEQLHAIAIRLHERYEGLLRTSRQFLSPFELPPPETTGESCPACKSGRTVIRSGKRGRFLGCSDFPDCTWSGSLVVGKCPECANDLIERIGRHGVFWGCLGYPDCKYTQDPGDA